MERPEGAGGSLFLRYRGCYRARPGSLFPYPGEDKLGDRAEGLMVADSRLRPT